MECSAKTGQYVDLIFKTAVEAVVRRRMENVKQPGYRSQDSVFDRYKASQYASAAHREQQRVREQMHRDGEYTSPGSCCQNCCIME